MIAEVLTIKEACSRWGVSYHTLHRAIKKGSIKAYKPGKEILVDVASGDSWWRNSGDKLVDAGSRGKRRTA